MVTMGRNLKCNHCVAEYLDAKNRQAIDPDVELPEILDAITLAPEWQQQVTMGQAMFACVAIPVCMEKHMAVHDPTGIQPAQGFVLGRG
jgi:hypothetical protein